MSKELRKMKRKLHSAEFPLKEIKMFLALFFLNLLTVRFIKQCKIKLRRAKRKGIYLMEILRTN